MSRTVHFSIGVVLGFICLICVVTCFFVYVGTAVDPASSAVGGLLIFGSLSLAFGFGAFWNLAIAFSPPPKEARPFQSPQSVAR